MGSAQRLAPSFNPKSFLSSTYNLTLERAATRAPTAPGSSPPQDVAAATRQPTMEVMLGPFHVHIVGNNNRAGWFSTCTQGIVELVLRVSPWWLRMRMWNWALSPWCSLLRR